MIFIDVRHMCAIVFVSVSLGLFQINCKFKALNGDNVGTEAPAPLQHNFYNLGNARLDLAVLSELPGDFRGITLSSDILFVDTGSYIWISERKKVWKYERSTKNWANVYTANSKTYDSESKPIEQLYCFDDATCVIKIGTQLLKTEDGGEEWLVVPSGPLSQFANVRSTISMPRYHTVILYGDRVALSNPHDREPESGKAATSKRASSPLVMKSSDGGRNWESLRFNDDDIEGGVHAIQFVDPNHGWALLNWQTFKTKDGSIFEILRPQEIDAQPAELSLLNKNTGWISYSGGVTYMTSDGGVTWELVNKGPFGEGASLWTRSMTFTSHTIGLGIADDKAHNKELVLTTDAGRTWGQPQNMPKLTNVLKIEFDRDKNIGLILTQEDIREFSVN